LVLIPCERRARRNSYVHYLNIIRPVWSKLITLLVFQQRRLFPFPLISASKDHKSGICSPSSRISGNRTFNSCIFFRLRCWIVGQCSPLRVEFIYAIFGRQSIENDTKTKSEAAIRSKGFSKQGEWWKNDFQIQRERPYF
jgi:hypothetical protein